MKDNQIILHGFNATPALLCPLFAGELRHAAMSRREEEVEAEVPFAELCAASMGLGITDRTKPFIYSDGIAFIPVYGVLVNRFSYDSEYITGYNRIREKFEAAMNDASVKGIVFDVNSYGGQVAGNFELAEDIRKARKDKPSMSIVDGYAYSGGYSLGSAAGRMVAGRAAGLGSIGVVMMHASYEKMLTDAGIEITFIYRGEQKIDGNMYKDLPEAVRQRFQAQVDKSYEKFVSLVVENRRIEAKAVRDTEAGCFDAEEALKLGLIDAIQTPKDAVSAFKKELQGSSTNLTRVYSMSDNNTNTTAGNGATAASDATTPAQQQAATPAQDAAGNERARIRDITCCDEAKGRSALANHIAFNTSMSVDDAKKMLAAAPQEGAAQVTAAARSPFEAAMEATQNPNVKADAPRGDDDESASKLSPGERIARNYSAQTGTKLRESQK